MGGDHDERCETCRFFRESKDEEDGFCRRFPPVLSEAATRHISRAVRADGKDHPKYNLNSPVYIAIEELSAWAVPPVDRYEWCGEYQPRRPLPVVSG